MPIALLRVFRRRICISILLAGSEGCYLHILYKIHCLACSLPLTISCRHVFGRGHRTLGYLGVLRMGAICCGHLLRGLTC